MPLQNDELAEILAVNPIAGVDYADGLCRFGNQVAIYLRIIKSFIVNTPPSLDELAAVTPATLADYAIRVHGLKGSCYGISAVKFGDEAKALELASKAEDWETVRRDNPALLTHITELIEQLQALVDKVENAETASLASDPRPQLAAPDKEIIRDLLFATQDFDVEGMKQAIDELDQARYASDPKLVEKLREHLTNFRYDLIEDDARDLLQ